MKEQVRAHVVVSGRVQGVYYRDSVRILAHEAGVTGWVRNRPDRRVEAVLEGPEPAVRKIVEWCHRGPAAARVEHVEVSWSDATGEYGSFDIAG